MTLDDLDNIRSDLNILRGELAIADLDGDFAGPLFDLSDAVRTLGRPGMVLRQVPPAVAVGDLAAIWSGIVKQEDLLRRLIRARPDLHGPAAVALHDVSRAANGMIAMFARRHRRDRP